MAIITFSAYPSDPPLRGCANWRRHDLHLICLAEDHAPRREKQEELDVTRLPITHRRGSGLSYAYQYSALLTISASILAVRSLKRRYSVVYVHNMPDFLALRRERETLVKTVNDVLAKAATV